MQYVKAPTIARRSAAGFIVMLAAIAGGCATTGQRVSLDCNFGTGEKPSSVGSTFSDAATCTDTLVKNVRTRLTDHETRVDAARAGTVLGTLGATVAGVYSAHRDTIVGLGLLGGSSFAYGSLYAPPPFLAIYAAGLDAAQCASGVARQAAGTATGINNGERALKAALVDLDSVQPANKGATADVLKAADAVRGNAQAALLSASALLAQEPYFANGLINIAYEISGAIDQQIIANTPTLETFRDASQAALGMAQSMVPVQPSTAAPVAAPADRGRVASTESVEDQNKHVREATERVADATNRLQAMLKAFGSADASACLNRAKNPALRPFVLVPAPAGDEILLEKSGRYSFTAAGGQPSYSAFFVGGKPAVTELVVTQDGSVFTVEAKDTLKQEYVLLVKDSGTGAPKQVKIKPKPAEAK